MSELTTLCYINKEDKVLFIHKSEEDDPNCGKYLGIGGHFEMGETPDGCCLREIYEETGIRREDLSSFTYRGIVTFVSDRYGVEYMHVFSADYTGEAEVTPGNCSEGKLIWIPVSGIYDLPVWEGDKLMFDCLYKDEGQKFFSLRLQYEGEDLVSSSKEVY